MKTARMHATQSSTAVTRSVWNLLKVTAADWKRDKVPRLGAALAYYTVFSLPPLLVLILALTGLVFGQEAAQSQLLRQFRDLLGDPGADAIQEMIGGAHRPSRGLLSATIGIVVLLFGASGVFGELQDALNTVWDVKAKPGTGIGGFIKSRFLSFTVVLGTGFLLLVSLVLSAIIAALGNWVGTALAGIEPMLHLLNFLLSMLMITVLFAMIFKILPNTQIAWRDVWIGAFVTALLFTGGKLLLGLYLGHASFGAAYGAAASVIIVLVWVYYSAQILLLGAEFTQAYARMYGSLVGSPRALPVTNGEDY